MEELRWMVGMHLALEVTAKRILIFDPLLCISLSKFWLRVSFWPQACIGPGWERGREFDRGRKAWRDGVMLKEDSEC